MGVFEDLDNYNPNQGLQSVENARELSPTENFIAKLHDEGIDTSDMLDILKENRMQLIVSGAGSGKTTVLLFKLQYSILSGEATKLVQLPSAKEPVRVMDSILVCTFLKSATLDMEERLRDWQVRLGYNLSVESIKFKTLHAEFMDVLRSIGVKVNIISPEQVRAITKEACKRYRIVNENTNWMSKEDYKIIESIFTYARNRLDYKRYDHPAASTYGITPTILDNLLEYTKSERRKLGLMDYEDSQEILYGALKVNPELQNFVAKRYSIIYLDEFQDTSQVQYEVLKYYFKGAKKVFFIGDDDQTIYTWRGSDIDIIVKRVIEDYNPVVQHINTNYRCPSNILNPVIPCISMNKNRYEKQLKSYNEGGVFNVEPCTGIVEMLNKLLDGLAEDRGKNYKVAIITRTNYDGLIPALILEYGHVYNYSISSASMALDTALAQSIINTSSLFTHRCNLNVKRTLEMLVSKQSLHEVGGLYTAMSNTSGMSIWTMPIDDIDYSVPEITYIIKSLREIKENEGEVSAFKRLLVYLKLNTYDKDNEYCNGARDLIDIFLYIIEDRKYKRVADFVLEMNELNEQIKARVRGAKREGTTTYRSRGRGAKVVVCTAHDAKGKEFDSVYHWKVNNGVFPSSYEQGDDIEEERRLFYIVVTRAMKKYTALTSRDNMSQFLTECDIDKSNIINKIRGRL